MLVKCLRESLRSEHLPPWASESLKHRVGIPFAPEVGTEYVVLQISFGEIPGVIVHHDEFGYPVEAPLALFEVLDGRPSRHWILRYVDNVATFAPPDLHRPYLVDDLSDFRDAALATMYG